MQRDYDIVIVGGGHAGQRAARAARAANESARIAILGEEPHLPYERPSLSKAFLKDAEHWSGCEPFTAAQYAEARIDLVLHDKAERLDRQRRLVSTANGLQLSYGRLVYATGSRVRRLDLPEDVAANIHYLRSRDDADNLRPLLKPGARIAVVGGGFIGLEVASTARELGAAVSVVEQADRVLARVLPEAVSREIEARHKRAGINLLLSSRILEWQRLPSGDIRIRTSTGRLDVETVVVGIGVLPNIEMAASGGLAVDDGLLVDESGATSDPHIFGAGEVTRHPVSNSARRLRLESWQVAELQSQAAGASAAGSPAAYDAIPWFWSDQLDTNIQVLGTPADDAQVVRRDNGHGAFSLFFVRDGILLATIALDSGKDIAGSRRFMTRRTPATPEKLADPGVSWRDMLA